MTTVLALDLRSRVVATLPDGSEIAGVVVAVAAHPVAFRKTSPELSYDVLTADGVSRPAMPAAALRRME
mgnify:CR=1 FL=1